MTDMSASAGPTTRLSNNQMLIRDMIMPGILLAFATYLLIGSFTMNVPEGTIFPGPRFFPGIVIIGLYLLAVVLIIESIRERRHDERWQGDMVDPTAIDHIAIDWRSFTWVVGGFLGFALLLSFLGWVIAAGALFWCVARGFGEKNLVAAAIAGFTVSSLTYIGFAMVLGLQLPSGLFGWGV